MDKTNIFVEKAKKTHGNKYDYSKVEYENAKTKVIIGCRIHNIEFKQTPNGHLNGHGCPECGIEKVANKKISTTAEFIKKAIKIHGDKYDYSKVEYKKSKTKVIIGCREHNVEFKQTPSNHLKGSGCRKCAFEKTGETLRSSVGEFIKKAKEIHGDKYDYSKVEYKATNIKIIITCKMHNIKFKQTPDNHLQSKEGCSRCLSKKMAKLLRSNTIEFIKKAKEIHGNKYDYAMVKYEVNAKKIIIFCKKHKKYFKQSPKQHLRGGGCPSCACWISRQSQLWLDELSVPQEQREVRIKLFGKLYILDGLDEETMTAYEYNGDSWHGNPAVYNPNDIHPVNKKTYGELYQKTKEKETVLKKAGYKVVSIWESEWKEINKGCNT